MIDSSPTPALPKPINPPTMPGCIDLKPVQLASWYDGDCIDQEDTLAFHTDLPTSTSPIPYVYTIELELIPISPTMLEKEEEDAHPFCSTCGKVLQEKWEAIGACSCKTTQTSLSLSLSQDRLTEPEPLLTLQGALHLEPEDDGHPFCRGCGQVLEESYGVIGKCLCDEVNDEIQNEIEWGWDFCSQVLLPSEYTSRLETIMEVDEAEDAYPFCGNCGKVLREGWGAVGECSCEKMR